MKIAGDQSMFNGVPAISNLFADLRENLFQGNTSNSDAPPNKPMPQSNPSYSYDIKYSSAEFRIKLGGDRTSPIGVDGDGSGRLSEFSSKVFEARLSGRLGDFSVSGSTSSGGYQSQVPSPKDVADKVLGFIERRIENAAKQGAEPEKLENLFSKAAEGVSRGYKEALEELTTRGLLNDQLKGQIDEGYQRIQSGLSELRDKYLPSNDDLPPPYVPGSDLPPPYVPDSPPPYVPSSDLPPPYVPDSPPPYVPDDLPPPYVPDNFPPANDNQIPDKPLPIVATASYSRTNLSASNVGIQVTTQDGDSVRIRMVDLAAENSSLMYSRTRGEGASFSATKDSFQVSGYQFDIEGDLDEGEMKALEELVLQVEGIADNFFGGDFNAAFGAAMQLDVDMGEIANYAVSMRSLEYRQTSVAYQRERSGSEVFQPLANQVDAFAQALAAVERFSQPAQLVRDFLQNALELKVDDAKLRTDYLNFSDKILEKLSTQFS